MDVLAHGGPGCTCCGDPENPRFGEDPKCPFHGYDAVIHWLQEREVALTEQLRGAVEALERVEQVLMQIDVDLTAQGHPPTSPDRERVRKGLAVIYHQRGR